jgi:putative aldouronate transport system substrate-binding protein
MSDIYVDTVNIKFTEDEQYVIENKYGEINTYINQMEAAFISGSADIETEWDTYVQTLQQKGIEEVTAVFQAGYDRFNESMAAVMGE